jgi:hypothetical protein
VSDAPTGPGVIEPVARVFDPARQGSTDELAGDLDAGVPVDPTTSTGDTWAEDRAQPVLAAPGGPSARASATCVELAERTDLLDLRR